MTDNPDNKKFLRFESHSGTCGKTYENFFDGLFTKFQDVFFYVHVLQFFLVTLMYYNIGKGKYWKILLWASTADFFGAIIENSTVAFICRKSVEEHDYTWVTPFIIAEFGWIIGEFSIPFLNLTKLKSFADEKFARKFSNVVLGALFPLFICCRFYIGYHRMKYGVLTTSETKYGHAAAFSVMAIADFICTIAILYFVRKNNSQEEITHYIKRSSYIILLFVDAVGILLAIANAVSEYFSAIPNSLVNPLHCIKCSVILILASDALLFRYSHNMSTVQVLELDNDIDIDIDDVDIKKCNNIYSTASHIDSSSFHKSFDNPIDNSNFHIEKTGVL